MDIALANDEYYFVGLWSTVLSLLSSTPDASSLRIHVIDTGISDASWKRLSDAVAKHPEPPQLLRKIFPRERLDGLDIPGTRSPLVYARLFLPELLDCDRVLYLDSDLLIFRDVLELKDIDLSGHACAAVINEDAGTLDFDLSETEYTRLHLNPKSKYYNAGLLYMNLDYWRSNDFTHKCLDFLKHHQYRLADQSALNAVMNGKILTIDNQWNRLAGQLAADEVVSPCCVIHYTSHKPWLLKSDAPVMLLWNKFAQDTKLKILPPRQKVNIYERYFSLNILRATGYGVMALWHSIFNKQALASGYVYAFSYWVTYCAGRKIRGREFAAAAQKIKNNNYGPSWLSDGRDSSEDRESYDESPRSGKKMHVKGRILTSMLRDRGRTRRLISSNIQRRLESRLKGMLHGSKKPNISNHRSDVSVSVTSWSPRERTLPLVLLSIIEQSLRPAAVHVWLWSEDQGMIGAYQRDFFAEYGVQFHETSNIGPHKKWLPYIEQGNESPFVVVDDDTYYPGDWFKALVAESNEHPDEIIAHRCHQISVKPDMTPDAYSQWPKGVSYQENGSHFLFPVGCGGVMILPEAIGEEFRSRDLIEKLCPRADDIWLKAAYLHTQDTSVARLTMISRVLIILEPQNQALRLRMLIKVKMTSSLTTFSDTLTLTCRA